jgi:hypothetical protein
MGSGQRVERAATAFAWASDIVSRDETIVVEKNLAGMTKVISDWTEEGYGCNQAHPEATAAVAGSMKRRRI